MKKNEKLIPDVEKDMYTFQMLLNDIIDSQEEVRYKEGCDNIACREYRSKLIVIHMLIDLAQSYSAEIYKDNKKLRNAIDPTVNNDGVLSGFIFYISQNQQFDYSWNYLRKLENKYKEFLSNTVHFFNNVVKDINLLLRQPVKKKGIHVVINDLFDISLIKEKPFVKTRVLWDNFYIFTTVRRYYNISIKMEENVLIVGNRKVDSDTVDLYDTALKMVNKTDRLSK